MDKITIEQMKDLARRKELSDKGLLRLIRMMERAGKISFKEERDMKWFAESPEEPLEIPKKDVEVCECGHPLDHHTLLDNDACHIMDCSCTKYSKLSHNNRMAPEEAIEEVLEIMEGE